LADDLAVIRGLIKSEAQFSEAQKSAVLAALTSFTSSQRLRFRSSTNVEDTDTFTGAGLYDSETGCAADDQDQDTVGPSACNAAQPQERGVFRALQKVYASFYNDNAVRERLRLQIDEDQVGMAVLVHYSYPDVEELANGVATYTWKRLQWRPEDGHSAGRGVDHQSGGHRHPRGGQHLPQRSRHLS
jgi:phosphoenolpyruvate synthase/pyruvate phosphate dikinase